MPWDRKNPLEIISGSPAEQQHSRYLTQLPGLVVGGVREGFGIPPTSEESDGGHSAWSPTFSETRPRAACSAQAADQMMPLFAALEQLARSGALEPAAFGGGEGAPPPIPRGSAPVPLPDPRTRRSSPSAAAAADGRRPLRAGRDHALRAGGPSRPTSPGWRSDGRRPSSTDPAATRAVVARDGAGQPAGRPTASRAVGAVPRTYILRRGTDRAARASTRPGEWRSGIEPDHRKAGHRSIHGGRRV